MTSKAPARKRSGSATAMAKHSSGCADKEFPRARLRLIAGSADQGGNVSADGNELIHTMLAGKNSKPAATDA